METEFKPKGRPYNILVTPITGGQEVTVDPCCNSWIAINKGNVIARVNGIEILPRPFANVPGEPFGVGGDEGDIYKGRITISFDAGANPLVVIVQYVYISVTD